MNYYAHTAELPDGEWQLLATHLRNVAGLAKRFAAPLGLASEAELAGLLHDLGKYRDEFQEYLRGERARGGETQHAIYGAKWLFDKEQLGSAFGVAGHHAGLHDLSDLQSSTNKSAFRFEEVVPKLEQRFGAELGAFPMPPGCPSHVTTGHAVEMYTRLLFSCLVDADRLDTALWPHEPPSDQLLRPEILLENVEAERERKRATGKGGRLCDLRNRIFDACVAMGAREQGFFSLTVPTGGGKTLSAMAFALAHAREHGLRRVIVVIPYLSIIEQNAAEYRRVLGEEAVLENHSAVEPKADVTEAEKNRLDLISENWDAPIILTTSVQFLESLFAASPSRCRKLHRIARSVVIFDEVQTLPAHLLQPIFSVFRELQRNYGVTFVFSSATQPAFRSCASLPEGFASDELHEIAPEPSELFRRLRRVRYHLPKADEALDWPYLAERLAATPRVLCVVNLVRHAAALWEQLSRLLPPDQGPIHLSAAMCPQHRLDLIRRICKLLCEGQTCRVISTQLVEAGVDLDFPVVWRAMGPLDSIVQVAGRCNREGRLKLGEMHVFRPADYKLPSGVYRAAADQTAIVLASLGSADEAADCLATDHSLFADYFQQLWQVVNTDYTKKGEAPIQEDRAALRFRRVAEKAKVIPDAGQPVIVRYGDGATIVDEIQRRVPKLGESRFTRDDLRRLQRFMVNVRTNKFQIMQAQQLIRPLLSNLELFVLSDGLYHQQLGIVIDSRPLEDFLL